jgi:hypothetical protein
MHAGLPFHPLAALFQLTGGAAYAALVEDIRAHGLNRPVVLYQDMILDGRNRYRACIDADVPVRTIPYDGDDPFAFVRSENLLRRHSNESQRAMGASRLATLPKGSNQHAQWCAPSQEEAADLFNVSRRSVQHARIVLDHAEQEVVNAVDAGLLTVKTAASIARQPRERQLARLERDRRKGDGTNRHEDDWYRTPPECVLKLLAQERFGAEVWEPACGDGAISRVLTEYGHTVVSTDLVDRGFGYGGVDFLAERALRADDLITNPPYELADDFAVHALELGVRKMALLCRLAWLEGKDRYDRLYSHHKLARVWVFSPRQTLWRGDEDTEDDGGMTAYAWFVFEGNNRGAATLGWLS